MNANQPTPPEQPAGSSAPEPGNAPVALTAAADPGWRRLRMTVLGGLAVMGSGLLFTGLLTASSGWYTSRSEFCNSCHIMEPYYTSWQESSHAHVACIKCHFPPGAAEKIRGKMLGLIQLATYLTRSQGPRPVADVPDASCLRSGCHETNALGGHIDFQEIPFDHTPHLAQMPDGEKLRCTSCHSQLDQSQHMTVNTANCYLCHFKGGHFNEGLGACTRCHEIPQGSFDLGGGVQFSHELAYERGTDCRNCHGDVIRGEGLVSQTKCRACHNREADLEKISDKEWMHQLHITDHSVACLDCHDPIEHTLQPELLAHAASDCASCHPNHHHEQVDMLQGVGAEMMPGHATVMLTARVECRACHRVRQVSPTGTVIWKASADVCTSCHSPAVKDELLDYHEQMRESLQQLESAVNDVSAAVDVTNLKIERFREIQARVKKVQHDVAFLKVANGIHNIHYANTLTRVLLEEVIELSKALDIPEPEIMLPEITLPEFSTNPP